MKKQSDADLLRKIRKGNQAALDILTKRKANKLYGIAIGILRDAALAEDAVIETFTELATKYEQIREDNALNGWLVTVIGRKTFDIIRKRKQDMTLDNDAVISIIDGRRTDTTDICETIHIYNCLAQLHKLDPRQYEAFSLSYQGLTLKQISRIMSTSKSQTETLIKNAKVNFKKLYD